MTIKLKPLSGQDLQIALPALARLRIEIFAAYPYLYAGTEAYEQTYLQTYGEAKDAFIIAAETEHGEIVGCATGSALTDHHDDFVDPLTEAGHDPRNVFYFGESVLLPSARGQGLGHAFFDAREAHARACGYAEACFCAVARPANHPQRPAGYTPLDAFWGRRGYRKLAGISAVFDWPEVPNGPDLPHEMNYWIRSL
ncbi:MAG: GNAT family N-acetyltransferase [Hyphomonadaceae bacterium]|nr:GNAT family N-acetyltransferase [Hyphomonadaceae bacterium]